MDTKEKKSGAAGQRKGSASSTGKHRTAPTQRHSPQSRNSGTVRHASGEGHREQRRTTASAHHTTTKTKKPTTWPCARWSCPQGRKEGKGRENFSCIFCLIAFSSVMSRVSQMA